MPQEAHLRRRLQEPRGGLAGTFAQRRLTKRSREGRQGELRRLSLSRIRVNWGKDESRSPVLRSLSYSVSTSGDFMDDSLDHVRGALGVHSSEGVEVESLVTHGGVHKT